MSNVKVQDLVVGKTYRLITAGSAGLGGTSLKEGDVFSISEIENAAAVLYETQDVTYHDISGQWVIFTSEDYDDEDIIIEEVNLN